MVLVAGWVVLVAVLGEDAGVDEALSRVVSRLEETPRLAWSWSKRSAAGSLYEQYGDTCAGRQPPGTGLYCADVFGATAGQTTTTTAGSSVMPHTNQQTDRAW